MKAIDSRQGMSRKARMNIERMAAVLKDPFFSLEKNHTDRTTSRKKHVLLFFKWYEVW